MKRTKRLVASILAIIFALGLSACGAKESKEETKEPVVETFAAEYEMKGTTSAGKPKNDTFIFEGSTEDGIITKLNFDIIRNKGQEGEYSKKDIMGYQMNVSDAVIEKAEDGFNLTKLTAAGFDKAFEGGQYMVTASCDNVTDTTKFKDLTFINLSTQGELEFDKAMAAYKYVATEAGIEDFTEDTLVKDIVSAHGLYKDGAFVEGSNRISFAGFNGGRSYGEQIDAIANHILNEKMTLEDVYEMFKTVNQMSQPIEDRDVISGATISFVGDFQRMVYLAMHGELFEGVVTHTEENGNTKVEVVTQGYGGEIETHVTFNADGKIEAITVRDANETPDIGGVLTAENSEYLQALIAGQESVNDVEAVSGATTTSNALTKAVSLAIEYYNGL